MSDIADTNKIRHERAMKRGAWQCPRCEYGFLVYTISDDKNKCAVCGYAGGNVHVREGSP